MSVRGTLFATLLAAVAALACAGAGSSQPKLVWVRDDGTPAERDEILAARDACRAQVDVGKIQVSRRFGHTEYVSQVIDCIKAKGYHLVDAPEE